MNMKIEILYWYFYLKYKNNIVGKKVDSRNILLLITLLLKNIKYLLLLIQR